MRSLPYTLILIILLVFTGCKEPKLPQLTITYTGNLDQNPALQDKGPKDFQNLLLQRRAKSQRNNNPYLSFDLGNNLNLDHSEYKTLGFNTSALGFRDLFEVHDFTASASKTFSFTHQKKKFSIEVIILAPHSINMKVLPEGLLSADPLVDLKNQILQKKHDANSCVIAVTSNSMGLNELIADETPEVCAIFTNPFPFEMPPEFVTYSPKRKVPIFVAPMGGNILNEVTLKYNLKENHLEIAQQKSFKFNNTAAGEAILAQFDKPITQLPHQWGALHQVLLHAYVDFMKDQGQTLPWKENPSIALTFPQSTQAAWRKENLSSTKIFNAFLNPKSRLLSLTLKGWELEQILNQWITRNHSDLPFADQPLGIYGVNVITDHQSLNPVQHLEQNGKYLEPSQSYPVLTDESTLNTLSFVNETSHFSWDLSRVTTYNVTGAEVLSQYLQQHRKLSVQDYLSSSYVSQQSDLMASPETVTLRLDKEKKNMLGEIIIKNLGLTPSLKNTLKIQDRISAEIPSIAPQKDRKISFTIPLSLNINQPLKFEITGEGDFNLHNNSFIIHDLF